MVIYLAINLDQEHLPFNLVYMLHKSIYGLEQTSRQWHYKFVGVVLAYGFHQSQGYYSLFVKGSMSPLFLP